jgi:hypothetical protein
MFNIRRQISILLLVCFLPVITPKEFIHALLGHDDTECYYHSDLTIDKIHRHCKILQITASSFIADLKNYLLHSVFQRAIYFFSAQSFISGISFHLSHLRAPPVNNI